MLIETIYIEETYAMLDLTGDLTEAIDNMVDQIDETSARFVGGLRSSGKSRYEKQSKKLTDELGKYFGPEIVEIFGFYRMLAIIIFAMESDSKLTHDDVDLRSLKRMAEEFATDIAKNLKVEDGEIDTDFDEVRRLFGLGTHLVFNAFRKIFNDPSLADKPTPRPLNPSEAKSKFLKIYQKMMDINVDNVSRINNKVDEYLEIFTNKVTERIEQLEAAIAAAATPATTPATTPASTSVRLPYLSPIIDPSTGRRIPRTRTISLQEDKVVQTVVDFNELRSQNMNEMLLQQFGAVIELVLDTVFSKTSLPIAFKGSQRDMSAFAKAIGGEKKYIETARKYGLDHPTTYKNKAKLNNAIKKFEKETGIKWPFK